MSKTKMNKKQTPKDAASKTSKDDKKCSENTKSCKDQSKK